MGVKLEVGKPLENNKVEVNATYDGTSRRKFSVPQEKADEFVSTYKKKYTQATILSTIGMCLAGGAGGIIGGQFVKNTSKSWVRWTSVIGCGLLGYITSMILTAKPLINMDKNIQKQFGAEELKHNNETSKNN